MIPKYEIPDVRDGLTSLQRRILWTMKNMGLTSKKPHKKAIKVVNEAGKGENLGGYADFYHCGAVYDIYDVMVKMTQDWRSVPLIHGNGNWGSVMKGTAAACRFTECRLSEFSEKVLLAGLNQRTVKFVSNPNMPKGKEPSILPAHIPNVLVRGTIGTSHIPPHNLGEVIDACIAMIENPDLKPEQLLDYIKGPDFPTGGVIINKSELQDIYQNGAGEIRIRSRMEENATGKEKKKIIITEIAYPMIGMVDKLLESFKYMKKELDIKQVLNTSSFGKFELIIILKKSADVEHNIGLLYEYTDLESSFDYRALLTSNGKPCLMSLHQILSEWLEFYRETRTKQNHGATPTNEELIAELMKIKEQFAAPRKTKIIDAD